MAGFDVAVVGLGAMGSAALDAVARRGLRAVGIERFEPGHDRGSSHGATRIIRLGYFEHPSYVPLVREAYRLWRDIEARSGHTLLHVTGIIEIGPPDGPLVRGTLQSSHRHDLPHAVLDAAALMQRWPAFCVPSHFVGVFQPDGGFLAAEPAVHTQVKLAAAAGAAIRTGETVQAIEPRGQGVRIRTDRGTINAAKAIIAAGPWLTTLVSDLAVPLHVTRQVIGWFEAAEKRLFSMEEFPVFILESRHGMHYGFPLYGRSGVKVAKHHHRDTPVDPEACDRTVVDDDERLIRSALADHIPAANGRLLAATTCLYTNTPDGDFILDRLPSHPAIIVASPCSGHGFKFAPVVGQILADLAQTGTTARDISRFRLARFG
jgi:sarcosine oxidase